MPLKETAPPTRLATTLLIAAFMIAAHSTRADGLTTPSLQEKADIVSRIRHAHALTAERSADNPEYGWAFELRAKLEKDMGLRDPKTGTPLRDDMRPTDRDLKKISGGWFGHDQRGDYARALRAVQEAAQASRNEYQTALDMTREAYNMPTDVGDAVNGPPSYRGMVVFFVPQIDDWSNISEGAGLPGRMSEGHVYIRPSAFFNHADIDAYASAPDDHYIYGDPDLGYLASIMYHESLHADDFFTPPSRLDLRNEPAREVTHRLKQLLNEDIFQVPSHDFLADLKNLVWQDDLSRLWQDAMSLGHDPYDRTERQMVFEPLHISQERAQQIDAQVNHDARELLSTTDETDPASLERLKQAAETDFFRRLDNDQLRGLVSAWKEARRVDADRKETNRRIFAARMAQEVRRCGFILYSHDHGLFDGVFLGDGNGGFSSYRPIYPMAEEQFRAGLMLAAACVSIVRDRDIPLPCNDGLQILSAHADDAVFKSATAFMIGGPLDPARCITFLRDRIRATTDVVQFIDLEAAALADYKKAADEQERQDQRERRRRPSDNPGNEGRERPERPEPSNPGYNHPPAPGHCGFNSSGAYCD